MLDGGLTLVFSVAFSRPFSGWLPTSATFRREGELLCASRRHQVTSSQWIKIARVSCRIGSVCLPIIAAAALLALTFNTRVPTIPISVIYLQSAGLVSLRLYGVLSGFYSKVARVELSLQSQKSPGALHRMLELFPLFLKVSMLQHYCSMPWMLLTSGVATFESLAIKVTEVVIALLKAIKGVKMMPTQLRSSHRGSLQRSSLQARDDASGGSDTTYRKLTQLVCVLLGAYVISIGYAPVVLSQRSVIAAFITTQLCDEMQSQVEC